MTGSVEVWDRANRWAVGWSYESSRTEFEQSELDIRGRTEPLKVRVIPDARTLPA